MIYLNFLLWFQDLSSPDSEHLLTHFLILVWQKASVCKLQLLERLYLF